MNTLKPCAGLTQISAVHHSRFGAGHDEELPVGDIASASAIRRMIYAGRVENAASFLPLATRNIIHKSLQDGRCPVDIALIEPAVLGSAASAVAGRLC